MKSFYVFLIALLATLIVIPNDSHGAEELTPNDLLLRYIEARGGSHALEQLVYVERFGSFQSHQGNLEGTYHTCIKYPDNVAISIDAGQLQMYQIFAVDRALVCEDEFSSCQNAPDSIKNQLQETARIANREELFEKSPERDVVEWIEQEQSIVGYKYLKDGVNTELVYDLQTGLMSSKKIGQQTRQYSRWEQIGPILLPMVYDDYQLDTHTTTISLEWAKVMEQASPWCAAAFSTDSIDSIDSTEAN